MLNEDFQFAGIHLSMNCYYQFQRPARVLVFYFFIFLSVSIYFYFFWLRWVLVVSRGLFVSARWLLSSCGLQVFSLQLWCTGSRACGLCSLRHAGSLVEACGLSFPAACGILVPRPGNKPPCIGRWILYHWTTREVPIASYQSS